LNGVITEAASFKVFQAIHKVIIFLTGFVFGIMGIRLSDEFIPHVVFEFVAELVEVIEYKDVWEPLRGVQGVLPETKALGDVLDTGVYGFLRLTDSTGDDTTVGEFLLDVTASDRVILTGRGIYQTVGHGAMQVSFFLLNDLSVFFYDHAAFLWLEFIVVVAAAVWGYGPPEECERFTVVGVDYHGAGPVVGDVESLNQVTAIGLVISDFIMVPVTVFFVDEAA